MELFAVDLDQLAGVVVEHGGPQSHAAILARSLGIPMVGQVKDFAGLLHPGRRVLVDGGRGVVTLDPPADTVRPRRRRGRGRPPRPAAPSRAAGLPRVEVNINLLYEARPAVRARASAASGCTAASSCSWPGGRCRRRRSRIGIYRKLLATLDGRPVSIRTFDLRPDKLASYSHLALGGGPAVRLAAGPGVAAAAAALPRAGAGDPAGRDAGAGAHPGAAGDADASCSTSCWRRWPGRATT